MADVNSRSWRFQKCSELGYLQSTPRAWHVPRLRSRRLTMAALFAQCEFVFGASVRQGLPARNAALNARFGGKFPASGAYPDASGVLFLGFSDDPWQAATVAMAQGAKGAGGGVAARLPSCYTECDGCGHCGKGLPPEETRCAAVSEAFVAELLAR
jgi:hypothetical protein